MQTVAKNDYLIALRPGAEGSPKRGTFLFKCESLHKGIASGTVQKDAHLKDKNFIAEVPVKDIILNIGPNPHPGKVHGHDVGALYRGRRVHPEFGPLYWFYNSEKEIRDGLDRAFTRVWKTLKQARLEFVVQPLSCIWEIMPYHGEKWAGMYKRSSSAEKSPHRLQIRPEIMPGTEYPYVIQHEIGHHFHFEFMTSKKLNAQWIQLFKTTVVVRQIKRDASEALLENLLSQQDLPSDFKSSLEEEDAQVYKLILQYISREHSVTVKELDILFEAGYKDEIRGVWPTRGIPRKDLEPVVSEYACRSWRELFAESFAFRMTGKKLPKAIETLLDKSLEFGRANHE